MSALRSHEAPEVDVVIVAHDAGDYLIEAVRSAQDQVGAGRVVVVDAESTDGSVEATAAAYPTIRVLPAENRGFAAGNNIGIEATSDEYVLLLNPDAELARDALAALLTRANDHPGTAIVAPRVVDPGGGIQRGSFGAFPTLLGTLVLHFGRALDRARGGAGLARVERRAAGPVDWVSGACMLVRRSAIEDAGLMDEGFFLYMEDAEWCHRMQDRGWHVVIEPAATCVHHLGKSGGGSRETSQAYRDSFYRYCRMYGLWGLAAAARVGLVLRTLAGGRG